MLLNIETHNVNDNATLASYEAAQLIAESRKAQTMIEHRIRPAAGVRS